MPLEVRKKYWIPLELELQAADRSAEDWTQVLYKNGKHS